MVKEKLLIYGIAHGLLLRINSCRSPLQPNGQVLRVQCSVNQTVLALLGVLG